MQLFFTVFHFSARVSILKAGGYFYTKTCSNLLSSFQLCCPQTHQLTVASAQLQEVLTDPKEQSGGLRAFTQLNKTSLCVQLTDRRCHQRRMGQPSPPELSGSGPRMPTQPFQTPAGDRECLSDGTEGRA